MRRTARRLSALAATIGIAFSAAPASASSAGFGNVVVVLPHYAGMFFDSTGARSSRPACATNPVRWIIDVATPQGQAMAAALLTAQSRGKRISIQGTGTCALWGDTETVSFFQIED